MLGIPEIKEIWESIQQNKEAFSKQIDKWIKDGVAAIRNYADGKDNDFQPEASNAVAWGIIAQAFEYGLDPTDEKQRRMAAAYLLEKVSWTGISSDFKISLSLLPVPNIKAKTFHALTSNRTKLQKVTPRSLRAFYVHLMFTKKRKSTYKILVSA